MNLIAIIRVHRKTMKYGNTRSKLIRKLAEELDEVREELNKGIITNDMMREIFDVLVCGIALADDKGLDIERIFIDKIKEKEGL
jgi:NTP pyrophosphatase (non-canonical NTP hydrolase)